MAGAAYVDRLDVDQECVDADLRSIVECLFAAGYSESEIVDYLAGPFGLSLEHALNAVRSASGLGHHVSRDTSAAG
jgi:hypothetical protein